MDFYNYLNANYEIYQSIPETINEDVEFTELKEISPQKIYQLEPFYSKNNYSNYNHNGLKLFIFIILVIIFFIFIFNYFF